MKSISVLLITLCVLPMFVEGWQIGVEIEPFEACLAGAAWRFVGTEEWHESCEAFECDAGRLEAGSSPIHGKCNAR